MVKVTNMTQATLLGKLRRIRKNTMTDIQSIKNRFGIIGNSPELNYALHVAVQVANTDLTVLIVGESGVGKKLSHILFMHFQQENIIHLLQLTVVLFLKERSIRNYLAMKKDLLPVQWIAVKDILKQ